MDCRLRSRGSCFAYAARFFVVAILICRAVLVTAASTTARFFFDVIGLLIIGTCFFSEQHEPDSEQQLLTALSCEGAFSLVPQPPQCALAVKVAANKEIVISRIFIIKFMVLELINNYAY